MQSLLQQSYSYAGTRKCLIVTLTPVGKCKLGLLGTVIRTPFVSKPPKGSDTQKGKEGDKSKKAKSGRKEKGERTGVKTKKGNTVCASSGVVYICIMLVQDAIFCKGCCCRLLWSRKKSLSRNSCYVYSQDQEKSKLKNSSKQGSGSLVGTYFRICSIISTTTECNSGLNFIVVSSFFTSFFYSIPQVLLHPTN